VQTVVTLALLYFLTTNVQTEIVSNEPRFVICKMIVGTAQMNMDATWKENVKMSMILEIEEDANIGVIIYQMVDIFAYVIEDTL
jgi:hypothetical protein